MENNRVRTGRFTPEEPCRNCGDSTRGNYCPSCGQAKRDLSVSVGAMVADVLEDQFVLGRALPRTVRGLLLQPGRLTREYLEGRRVRYIAPFRLYLACSVVFFLVFSVFGLRSMDRSAQAMESQVDAVLSVVDPLPAVDSSEVTLQPWARTLRINIGSEETSARVRRRTLDRFGHLPFSQAARGFLVEYLRYAPQTVFLLLPIFALILKALYLRSPWFYAQHFVFSVHVHAFVFAAATFVVPLGWAFGGAVLGPAVIVYVWMALRTVYGQGAVRTTLKALLLGSAYGFALSIAFMMTILVTFLRL
jgi:hypothetical protein